MTTTQQTQPIGPALDRNHGKLGDEHGGAGTRSDDRKGETIKNEGDTTTPTVNSGNL